MKYIFYSISLVTVLCISFLQCLDPKEPILDVGRNVYASNHNVGFIPFDYDSDNPDFLICDSTKIFSGRNGVQPASGKLIMIENIKSNFISRKEYKDFNGFVIVRFLVNCENQTGRYRAQALNLDFTYAEVPASLTEHAIKVIKNIDDWTKASAHYPHREYSKFINLKISNGRIQNVLL